jgi:hypothetical protein
MHNFNYTTEIIVRLEDKVIGKIKEVPNGFQYCPKGSSIRGEVFHSIFNVKQSIEAP